MSNKNRNVAANTAPSADSRFTTVTKQFQESAWIAMLNGNTVTGELTRAFQTKFGVGYEIRISEGSPLILDGSSKDRNATKKATIGETVTFVPPTAARNEMRIVANELTTEKRVFVQVTFGDMTKNPKNGRLFRGCTVGYYTEAR